MTTKYQEIFRELLDIIRRCQICGDPLFTGDLVLKWEIIKDTPSPLGQIFKTWVYVHEKHQHE